jgi:hypothetical protein
LGVIFFCVIGIVYTPYLKKTFNGLACYTYKLVFDSYEGLDLEENNWIGLKNISERLNTLEEGDKNRYREGIETINSMKSTFEELGGTYKQVGDYLLPDIEVPENPEVGFWGMQRRKYLLEHQSVLYTAMFLGGKLTDHLQEIDRSATQMFDQLVDQLKIRNGLTEQLKVTDQMKWVRRMNAVRHEAAEIVAKELIYDEAT